ncbi:MAG: orotate phosphoribosyltransferase [Nitrospinae bacterium CG11_big_fil_rev_8_21_14_0_20_56_8]|nr:MAG: orotate phosphoribosyltransferase [Nitrospinae bacterium CG11_big_fil_rev_8_21_14_0_20_56_8]
MPPVSISRELAAAALRIGAIKISPSQPFTWASGYRMPLYNDNRLLLGDPAHRKLVVRGFQEIVRNENLTVDVVAGTATAGIPHATGLANALNLPLIYVRPAPKSHGTNNQIEGVLHPGQTVVVVEDLISTGGSALDAVQAVRGEGCRVDHCLCIFNYGFAESQEAFRQAQCHLHSLLTLETLLDHVREIGGLSAGDLRLVEDWKKSPFTWADRFFS